MFNSLFPPPSRSVGLQFPECTAGGETAPRASPYLGLGRNLGQRKGVRGEGSRPLSLSQGGILQVNQGSGWIPLEKLGEKEGKKEKAFC